MQKLFFVAAAVHGIKLRLIVGLVVYLKTPKVKKQNKTKPTKKTPKQNKKQNKNKKNHPIL